MLSRVNVKAEVVIAEANRPVTVIVLPLGEHDTVLPVLEQEVYEKAAVPDNEFLHWEGKFIWRDPVLGRGTFALGVIVNVYGVVAETVVLVGVAEHVKALAMTSS